MQRFEKSLEFLVNACALIGGVIVVSLATMTSLSVFARNFLSWTIVGDVEITGLGMAALVAYFLPICQWRKANIIVDFFTSGLSDRLINLLDMVGSLIMSVCLGLLAWRTVIGAMAVYRYNQTTMLLGLPEWIAYAVMVPPLVLTAFVALYMALRQLARARSMRPVSGS